MYRVMVVDDRRDVIEGICSLTDWADLQAQVVATAQNGQTALELLQAKRPDVVITDIKMPVMDGLSFIERAKALVPSARFIILSGYDDFAFAQQAMRLGVDEYILKPARVEDIDHALRIQLEHIGRQRREQSEQRQLLQSLPLLRDVYFRQLLSRQPPAQAVAERFQKLGLRLELQGRLQLALWELVGYPAIERQQGRTAAQCYRYAVGNAAQEVASALCPCAAFHYAENQVALLLQLGDRSQTDLLKAFRPLCEQLERELTLSVIAGLSLPFEGIEGLPHAFQQAVEALNGQFYQGGGVLCYAALPAWQSSVQYGDVETRLVAAIHAARPDAITQAASWLIETNRTIHPTQLKQAVQELYLILRHRVLRLQQEPSPVARPAAFVQGMEEIATAAQLRDWLIDGCNSLASQVQQGAMNQTQRYAVQACSFLEDRYADDISLTMVADAIGLTPPYLSSVFKEAVGLTFTEYLVQLRIEKAKELLLTRRYKVYELAQQVGYSDVKYFTEVFKRHTGCTPKEYLQRRT